MAFESAVVEGVTGWLRSKKRQFTGILQRIDFLIENTCDESFFGMAKLAVPALGKSAIVLFVPSWGEVLENYLEPKSRRGLGRRLRNITGRSQPTRNGGRRRAWGGGLPDIDEQIAAIIPARSHFAERIPSIPEAFVWAGINIADAALLFWMLVQISDDFTYCWASSLMKSQKCKEKWNVTYSGTLKSGGTGVNQNLRPPNISPAAGANIAWQGIEPNQSLTIIPEPPAKLFAIWTVLVSSNSFQDQEVAVNAGFDGPDPKNDFQLLTVPANSQVVFRGFMQSNAARNFAWDLQKDNPDIFLRGGSLSVFGNVEGGLA